MKNDCHWPSFLPDVSEGLSTADRGLAGVGIFSGDVARDGVDVFARVADPDPVEAAAGAGAGSIIFDKAAT